MTYIRCCIANRFTFAGYVLAIFIALCFVFPIIPKSIPKDIVATIISVSSMVSFILLLATSVGIDTYITYCRCRRNYRNYGRSGAYYVNYCNIVGEKLADKDFEVGRIKYKNKYPQRESF